MVIREDTATQRMSSLRAAVSLTLLGVLHLLRRLRVVCGLRVAGLLRVVCGLRVAGIAAALLFSVMGVFASAASAEEGAPLHKVCSALDDGAIERLNVLLLLDYSGSLKENDPGNLRAQGAKAGVDVLADLDRAQSLEVHVAVDSFATDYRHSSQGWVRPGSSELMHQLINDMSSIPSGRGSLFTDYKKALTAAWQRFEQAGSVRACNILVWFTDGEHDQPRESGSPGWDGFCASDAMKNLNDGVWVSAVLLRARPAIEDTSLHRLFGDGCENSLRGEIHDDFNAADLAKVLQGVLAAAPPPADPLPGESQKRPDQRDYEQVDCGVGEGIATEQRPCVYEFRLQGGHEAFRLFVDRSFLRRSIDNQDEILMRLVAPGSAGVAGGSVRRGRSMTIGVKGDVGSGATTAEWSVVEPFKFYALSPHRGEVHIKGHQVAQHLLEAARGWEWEWDGLWELHVWATSEEARADAARVAVAVRSIPADQPETVPRVDATGSLTGFVSNYPEHYDSELTVRLDRLDGEPVYPTRPSVTAGAVPLTEDGHRYDVADFYDLIVEWDGKDGGGDGESLAEAVSDGGGVKAVTVLKQELPYPDGSSVRSWVRAIGSLELDSRELIRRFADSEARAKREAERQAGMALHARLLRCIGSVGRADSGSGGGSGSDSDSDSNSDSGSGSSGLDSDAATVMVGMRAGVGRADSGSSDCVPGSVEVAPVGGADVWSADSDGVVGVQVSAMPGTLPGRISLPGGPIEAADAAGATAGAAVVGTWGCDVPAADPEQVAGDRRHDCAVPLFVVFDVDADTEGLTASLTLVAGLSEKAFRGALAPEGGPSTEQLRSDIRAVDVESSHEIGPVDVDLVTSGDRVREFLPLLAALITLAVLLRVAVAAFLRPWSPLKSSPEYVVKPLNEHGGPGFGDGSRSHGDHQSGTAMCLTARRTSGQVGTVTLTSRWAPLLLRGLPMITASSPDGDCYGPHDPLGPNSPDPKDADLLGSPERLTPRGYQAQQSSGLASSTLASAASGRKSAVYADGGVEAAHSGNRAGVEASRKGSERSLRHGRGPRHARVGPWLNLGWVAVVDSAGLGRVVVWDMPDDADEARAVAAEAVRRAAGIVGSLTSLDVGAERRPSPGDPGGRDAGPGSPFGRDAGPGDPGGRDAGLGSPFGRASDRTAERADSGNRSSDPFGKNPFGGNRRSDRSDRSDRSRDVQRWGGAGSSDDPFGDGHIDPAGPSGPMSNPW